MTRDEYWALIEKARATADESYASKADESREVWDPELLTAEHLRVDLEAGGPERIAEFLAHQDAVMAQSYTWSLWGAAYLMNGGCSDDGFEYFRGWLIAQGRKVFERALEDPDTLAEIWSGDEVECEDILSVATSAYETATGEFPEARSVPYPDLGERWDFDDDAEMERRFPKLWAKRG